MTPCLSTARQGQWRLPLISRSTSSRSFVAGPRAPTAQSRGVARSKLGAPRWDRLVRDGHAPLGSQLLDISQAQAEAELEPDGVADDLSWVAIAAGERRLYTAPSYAANR